MVNLFKTVVNNPWVKWFLVILGLGGSGASLYHFGHWQYWRWPPFALTVIIGVCVVLEIVSRAERLRRAAMVCHERLRFWDCLWVNAVGDLGGMLTPSSVGGDLSRLTMLLRLHVPAKGAVTTLVAERLALLLSLGLLMLFISLLTVLGAFPLVALTSLRSTFWVYLALLGAVGIAAFAMFRRQALGRGWYRAVLGSRIMGMAALHHLLRVALLPIVVSFFVQDPPYGTLLVWSFLLSYGVSLVPVPSAGGAVEFTFMAVLGPLLGFPAAGQSLVIWRLGGFYIYAVVSGILILLRVCPQRQPVFDKNRCRIGGEQGEDPARDNINYPMMP